jgi:DNA polymerase (family 10)
MKEKQTSLFPDKSTTLSVLQGLDRVEVEPLASKILQGIEPFCLRAEVAGSFRRRKDSINDLDIVIQPKPTPLIWLQILKTIRHEFVAVTEKQGDKLATLYLPFASKQGPGHIQVDFYRADPTTWGILLLVRTGSKEHNVYLCNLALSKGLRLQYSQGLTDRNGNVVASRAEEEVFEALGLPFIQPKDREV